MNNAGEEKNEEETMTPHDALAPDSTCHPEVWALLPWAVNGTVEGHERRAIEECLATCPCVERSWRDATRSRPPC